ncbi:hypothetical protein M758_10G187100 [Ceratodon purpureus]|nr:hypothetical protein M758_10G187100 [Ceratodon purpureus]
MGRGWHDNRQTDRRHSLGLRNQLPAHCTALHCTALHCTALQARSQDLPRSVFPRAQPPSHRIASHRIPERRDGRTDEALVNGPTYCARALDPGPWTLDPGPWTLDRGGERDGMGMGARGVALLSTSPGARGSERKRRGEGPPVRRCH